MLPRRPFIDGVDDEVTCDRQRGGVECERAPEERPRIAVDDHDEVEVAADAPVAARPDRLAVTFTVGVPVPGGCFCRLRGGGGCRGSRTRGPTVRVML